MKKIIFVSMLALSFNANSEPYATIGAGIPYHGEPIGVNVLGVAGIGYQITNTVAVELDYRWNGNYSGNSDYVADPTYANIGTVDAPVYACATDPCNNQTKVVNSRSKGAALSMVFERLTESGRVGNYFRAGVYDRHTKYADHWEAPISVSYPSVSADSKGLTAMFGAGVRFDNIRIEIVYYDKSFYKDGRLDPLIAAYGTYLVKF